MSSGKHFRGALPSRTASVPNMVRRPEQDSDRTTRGDQNAERWSRRRHETQRRPQRDGNRSTSARVGWHPGVPRSNTLRPIDASGQGSRLASFVTERSAKATPGRDSQAARTSAHRGRPPDAFDADLRWRRDLIGRFGNESVAASAPSESTGAAIRRSGQRGGGISVGTMQAAGLSRREDLVSALRC